MDKESRRGHARHRHARHTYGAVVVQPIAFGRAVRRNRGPVGQFEAPADDFSASTIFYGPEGGQGAPGG
jgi:hypothetical protein